jgi:hypothetical protein
VYIHTHTLMGLLSLTKGIYMCVYVCIYVYVYNNMCTLMGLLSLMNGMNSTPPM